MPDPRLYVEGDLTPGAKLRLADEAARKLTQVLRLGPGAAIRVFNAQDGEWRAELETADKRRVAIGVKTQLRPPRSVPDIDLLFAPVKRDATDLIIEKATELGARRLRPIITARTIAETVRPDRLHAIARGAAEQTERFDIPEIAAPVSLAKALDSWDQDRRIVWADESGEVWGGEPARPIAEALQSGSKPTKAALLIGPEGGFTPEERALLRTHASILPVSLGPRILRAETAVIAALAVVQTSWGDW